MADLVITAANVVAGSGAQIGNGTAGATLTAGDVLYIDTAASNVLKLADANAASPAYTVEGIALHASLTGQPIQYIKLGDLTLGAVMTQGLVYVLSANPGKIAPAADLASGWFTTVLGIAKSTSILTLINRTAGVAV